MRIFIMITNYDENGRIISQTITQDSSITDSYAPLLNYAQSFSYDVFGDLMRINETQNNAGALAGASQSSQQTSNHTTWFFFNALDHLISSNTAQNSAGALAGASLSDQNTFFNSIQITRRYDANGHRISETTETSNTNQGTRMELVD